MAVPTKSEVKVPSDIEIAQAADIRPIIEIAEKLGLTEDDLDFYGKYKAKIHLDVLKNFADRPQGKYIDVTAITPTPLGEGKSTTMVGLTQALGSELGKNVMCCIRQPSMGPTFNIKGGAAGGDVQHPPARGGEAARGTGGGGGVEDHVETVLGQRPQPADRGAAGECTGVAFIGITNYKFLVTLRLFG